MGVRTIAEELDFLQKKVASLREIHKSYSDIIIKDATYLTDEIYCSASVNKDADILRFQFEKGWLRAYPMKYIGNVYLHCVPEVFLILSYHPNDMFKQLVVQNYHGTMIKHNISEKLIKECDLELIRFIKKYNIDVKNTDVEFAEKSSTLGKLLPLL